MWSLAGYFTHKFHTQVNLMKLDERIKCCECCHKLTPLQYAIRNTIVFFKIARFVTKTRFVKYHSAHTGLPTLCFYKVWKLHEVLNVRVTAGHRRSQLSGGAFSVFVRSHRIFLQNRVKILEFLSACWWFCDGVCKK